MPKERYNLLLSETMAGGDQTETFVFAYDLKQLLPLNMKDKKFLVYSSFHTINNWADAAYATLEVATDVGQSRYSRSIYSDSFTTIGFAAPTQCWFDEANGEYNYVYSFNEGSCLPFTIDYPENQYEISVNILNLEADFVAGRQWALQLSFEVVDE